MGWLYLLFAFLGLGVIGILMLYAIVALFALVRGLSKAADEHRHQVREEQIENARFLRDLERKTGIAPAWPEDEQFAKMNRKRDDSRA